MPKVTHSPDDKVHVIVGDGDSDIRYIVRRVEVAFHGGPVGTQVEGRSRAGRVKILASVVLQLNLTQNLLTGLLRDSLIDDTCVMIMHPETVLWERGT